MRLLLVILFLMGFVGCASSGPQSDSSQDIQEATSDVGPDNGPPSPEGTNPPAVNNPSATGETSESDLQNDSGQMAANQPPPPPASPGEPGAPPAQPDAAQPPPATDQTPPPEQAPSAVEAPPLAPGDNSAATEDNGPAAVVTGLDYKANENGGTIVVRTDHPVQYTTRRNDQTNQFIIQLHNTTVPKRFQRPYPTKDFPGPIGSINAYQSKGTNEARVVVQLRENVEPAVTQQGSVIKIAGGGGAGPEVATAPAPEPQAPAAGEQAQEDQQQNAPADNQPAPAGKENLREHTLNDFLTGNTKFYGRPISLEVKDADVRDVFRFISEETGLNIIVSDDVTGKITLKLRQIPWDQALSVILQSKELGYVKQGNVLRIAPLKTLQAESDAAAKVIESQHQLEPLHVQVFPVSYAVASDLEIQAKDFLSPRGKVHADKRTNNLVVTDIDENLQRIKQLVQRLDTQTPEVLIEAKVVEARETFERMIGVNWTQNSTIPLGTNTAGSAINFQPSVVSGGAAQNAFLSAGFQIGQLDILGNLTATLALLESEQLVHVISAPRIVTLDRAEASIQQTTQFPTFSTSATTLPGVVPLTTISFQSVALQLTVTPKITMDGSIIMDVHVVREFADPPTIVNGSQARAVNRREAKTQVLVESGDTVVIGGIYQSDVTDAEVGVPWLSKLPVIGALFRQTDVQKTKNELVIFLTPRTLNREKAFLKQGGQG